jgi:hypothetical protein
MYHVGRMVMLEHLMEVVKVLDDAALMLVIAQSSRVYSLIVLF